MKESYKERSTEDLIRLRNNLLNSVDVAERRMYDSKHNYKLLQKMFEENSEALRSVEEIIKERNS